MTHRSLATLRDVFNGRLVYRNLIPADARLPAIGDLRAKLGLEEMKLPRKPDPEYAAVVVEILREARRLSGVGGNGARLLYIGDTRHNDVAAFSNLCRAMGWSGRAFIADESVGSPRENRQLTVSESVTVTDRWQDIADFASAGYESGFGCDQDTIVVVDIDKTLLGARGRNGHVIDQARREAAYEAARHAAGDVLADKDAFVDIYSAINKPAFHQLTGDNQDAVAYSSLLVASGVYQIDEVAGLIAQGRIENFRGLVRDVGRRKETLPSELARLQDSIREQVEVGNPTPFVAFRRAEYRETVARMGFLPDDAVPEQMLGEEIVLTEEVWEAILEWKARGALLLGLSDKPDEACYPLPETDESGNRPIHDTRTHIVGGSE
ncbi:hypothetical protein ACFLSG_00805 [Candidatus Bipolaricaulota bacterium]